MIAYIETRASTAPAKIKINACERIESPTPNSNVEKETNCLQGHQDN